MSGDDVAEAQNELAEAEGVFGPDHPHTIDVRTKLADALAAEQRFAEELPVRERIFADVKARNGAEHRDTGTCAHNYGFCYFRNGRPLEGIPHIEWAIQASTGAVGTPSHFHWRRNLAVLQSAAGRSDEAIATLERLLDEQQEHSTVDAYQIRRARIALANAYQEQTGPTAEQCRSKGEALWQLIIRTLEETEGPDDPETLSMRNSLAIYLHATGQRTRALSVCADVLADREKVLGPEHPDTLFSRNNLAIAYKATGDRASALPLFEAVYEQRVRSLGEDNRETLYTLEGLADCLFNLRRYEDAAAHYGKLVEARARVGGPDDPDRTEHLSWMGWSYNNAHQYEKAEEAIKQVVTDRERILGPEHVDTMTARQELADFFCGRTRYDEAIPVLERTLADRARILGAGRPDTVKTRSLLAASLMNVDRQDESVERRREDVEALAAAYGRDAQETISAVDRLGEAEDGAMRYGAALDAYQQALEGAERLLGPEHSSTVQFRDNVAWRLLGLGRSSEAAGLYEQVLENYRRNFSADDPRVLIIRRNLIRCHEGSGLREQALEEYRELLVDAVRVLPESSDLRRQLTFDLAVPPPACWWNRETLAGRKLWMVALNAIQFAEVVDRGNSHFTLYARLWLDRFHTASPLRSWWGIEDRDDLLESLRNLKESGLRAAHAKGPDRPAPAWDAVRYVGHVRDGVMVGYIEESEGWELLEPIAEMSLQAYGSWADYCRGYLAGRGRWLGLDSQEPQADWPIEHRRKHEQLERLLDPQNTDSPFNRAPWDTPRRA